MLSTLFRRATLKVPSILPPFIMALVCVAVTLPAAAQQAQPPQTDTDLEAMLDEETSGTATIRQFEEKVPEIREAATRFIAGDFKGAEDILTQAKEKNPGLPPAGVMMGIMYARANNAVAARNAYERAVRDDPTDPEPFVVFGDNALRQRRVTDAALLYDRAVATSEGYSANAERKRRFQMRAYSGSAAVAEARELWDDAEGWLRKAIELDKENINLLTRLGRVLFKKNQEALNS